jgi:hypothetical protein
MGMKKYIILGAIILILAAIISFQHERIRVIKEERNMYRQNTYSLLSEIEHYLTNDSLNAVSINQLELKLSEVNKYRSEDMKLIESLKIDKKRLQQITTAQTQTIYDLQGTFRDSIVYVDNFITDTLYCININEKWFDLTGCIDANSKFAGRFENRDSLLYVEHIVPKRFWFIKWGIKERRQEIVSRNPHTKIIGAEFITIKK